MHLGIVCPSAGLREPCLCSGLPARQSRSGQQVTLIAAESPSSSRHDDYSAAVVSPAAEGPQAAVLMTPLTCGSPSGVRKPRIRHSSRRAASRRQLRRLHAPTVSGKARWRDPFEPAAIDR